MHRSTHQRAQQSTRQPTHRSAFWSRYSSVTISLAVVLLSISLSSPALAGSSRTYEVTITNLTRAQVLTPPVVIAHRSSFELFAVGGLPSAGLAALAKDGVTGDLESELDVDPAVTATSISTVPVLPGQSISLMIQSRNRDSRLSVVGMLATTNDAIVALRGLHLPWWSHTHDAQVYDAAAEANTESCEVIPGPPCGNPFVSPPEDPEEFIHLHNGIHDVGDLDPAELDWRGPAARVTVRRVR
jgi:hypothetical protein